MSAVDALAWSLVHALWIGGLAWWLRVAVEPWLWTPVARYRASSLALFGTAALWVLSGLGTLWAPASSAMTAPSSAPVTWLVAAVVVWATGVCLLGARMLGGLWWLHRTVQTADSVPEWSQRFARLQQRAGVVNARLLASARVLVPCTVGWVRPVVLVPPALWLRLSTTDLEAIVLHELAHIRRHDWVVGLLQTAVETLLFHVPFVSWLSRRMRHERELCADALAATWVGSNTDYARALLTLEAVRVSTALAPASHGGSLSDRIHALVRPAQPRRGALGSVAAAWLSGLALVGGLAWAASPASVQDVAWMPADVRQWTPQLDEAAKRYGLDPALLAVVALIESGGDADALSPMGARGLMQVMPATADVIRDAQGAPRVSGDELSDPSVSADLAGWYLAQQLDAFEGDVRLALAAYNAGPKAVRAHLQGADLPRETERYLARAMPLYHERAEVSSPTYTAWWASRRAKSDLVAPLKEARATSEFGGSHHHRGLDLAAPRGTPVAVARDGVVQQAEDKGAYGLSVVVSHGGGLVTRYHHLDRIDVAPGQRVSQGAAVGTVGSTGVSSGPHLHWEVRELGEPVDPRLWLP